MEHTAYVDHLRAEAALLRAAAERGLDTPVPSCPGWTVGDAAEHIAVVYLHKVACLRAGQPPQSWPPPRDDTPTLELFDGALEDLLGELTSRDPAAPTWTWWPFDQTVAFWGRRMAQETLVHRLDVELAHDAVSPVDPELAVDGIDEVLVRMLAGDWSDEPVAAAAGATVTLRSGDQVWRVVLEPAAVVATPGSDQPADAEISGAPDALLRWLWGRGPLEPLTTSGAGPVVHALRERLALATQ